MPETQETFELLKNYVNEFPIGLLLFNSKKELVSWNKYILVLLGTTNEDLKKRNFAQTENQINEILNTSEMSEKDLIGLSKPVKWLLLCTFI